jgi:hypothetical protein
MAETTTTTTEEPQQQEAVAEQQPEVQETPTGLDDPMLSQLWDDLGIETEKSKAESTQNEEKPEVQPEQSEADKPKEEASEAEATNKEPEQEPEGEDETKSKLTESKKEFSVRPKIDEESFRKVVREELEARGKSTEPEPEPVASEPTVDPYEDQLIQSQKEELELYKYAESKGKHVGKANKLLNFYKNLDEYVDKAQAEDPDRTFDENDEDFMLYVRKNKPDIKSDDRDSLKRQKFRDEIVSDVKKEYEETISGLKGELNEIRTTPQVKSTLKEAGRAFDEFSKLSEIKESDPLKHKVFTEERDKYLNWANDFVNRWYGVNKSVDQGYYNIIDSIEQAAGEFANSGDKESTIKDGQQFLTPSNYAQAKDKRGYWTWDQNDILEHFGSKAIAAAEESTEKRIKELEAYGFKRGVVVSDSQDNAKEEPEPVNPPKATRAASPGQAEGASIDDNHPGKALIDDLGINFG